MATQSTTVAVGDIAPDFTLSDTAGQSVVLSGLRPSPVVLVFLRGFS